ncbi:hypothetical protein INT45_001851 [Circinella minor]|uniref:Uncharacterized protein n=1 Tax=Circinella minor TaxID=1195481 RepID=A0A8H7RZ42_9FUNG|nr:hypothetical protein INT45_001851 [Circinella minor]
MLSHEKLWERKLDDPINCLEVGKPFLEELSEENDILIGTTAGRVLILNQDKPPEVLLETKGGSVQALQLYDLTGQRALDLVVGDSEGVITMFSRQQILSKQEIGTAVTTIDIFKDLDQGYEIIAGGMNGTVTGFQPHEIFWSLKVAEESAKIATLHMKGRRSPYIHCILATTLNDPFGQSMAVLLVCDGWQFVHFLRGSNRILSLRVPTVICSMAAGRFLTHEIAHRYSKKDTTKPKTISDLDKAYKDKQVLMAGEDGCVYVMINYEIHQLFNVGFRLTKIIGFRPSFLKEDEPDLVICVGYANQALVYRGDKRICEIATADWPHNVTVGDVNADGQDELILGLLDQTVQVYRWIKTE